MARINRTRKGFNRTVTHEGGRAYLPGAKTQLERSVLACMLWEDTFYEEGESIVERINRYCDGLPVSEVIDVAIRAKEDMHLRHAPLWLVNNVLSRADEARMENISLTDVIDRLVTRPDDMTELVSMYWKDKKVPLSAQLKKGLAKAFPKFSSYQLAKYNRDEAVKLRDVLFLCHAKPRNDEEAMRFKQLIDYALPIPDTWEVAISAAKGDNEKTRLEWERLLSTDKLGALAFLRNLANMQKVSVSPALIRRYFANRRDWSQISPFQFISAFNAAPDYLDELEAAFFSCCKEKPKLSGKTRLLLDSSGSMGSQLSRRGTVTRYDAACGLAMILRELAEDVTIIQFGDRHVELPKYHGFALKRQMDAQRMAVGYSTMTGRALKATNRPDYDRTIVLTDEQAWDDIGMPQGNGYIINIGSYEPSIAYGKWVSLTGWSDRIVDYMQVRER